MKQTVFTCDECGSTEANEQLGNWWMGIATTSSYSLSLLSVHYQHHQGQCAHLCGSACADRWGKKAVEEITAGAVTGKLTGGALTGVAGSGSVQGGMLQGKQERMEQALKRMLQDQAKQETVPAVQEELKRMIQEQTRLGLIK